MDLNESRASKVATVIILCPALAATCVALRVYTRFVLGKKRFLEDYIVVWAMVRGYYPTEMQELQIIHTLYSSSRRRCPCAWVYVCIPYASHT